MSDFQQHAQAPPIISSGSIILPLIYSTIIGYILVMEFLWIISYLKYLMNAANARREKSPSPARKKKKTKKTKKSNNSDSE
jgi:Na+-transporting methylmalonyl-CoA/oxaloacetate decarboxylase gamma subunit